MNKRARAAAETARRAALDAALDDEIVAASAPLRVNSAHMVRFDAQLAQPLPPLTTSRIRRLRNLLDRALPDSTPQSHAEFGPLIHHARQAAGLAVPELARRLHIHRDYLTGLEAGTRSPLALGSDGARRLVGMLGISPHAAALALETSMHAALAPVAGFTARMKRGVPRKERLRVLEAALPAEPSAEQARGWRSLIEAVEALDDSAASETT